ncbi:MAG: hypothetical protein IJD17_03135 [Clostridia bacterium]|nr:hypothetical protein [Clostridia bacterium]
MKDQGKSKKGKLFDIAKSIGEAAKTTADALGTTTKNAAVSIATTVKSNSEQLNVRMEQKRYDNDLKRYCPIYEEDLKNGDLSHSPMIRIVGEDVRRTNKACEGAVGFYTEGKGMKVLNIYKEHTDLLSLEFHPYQEESVYYVDPCHSDFYIRIDEYFAYLKKVRVDELIMLAQDLGAKHVEVVLKATKTNSSDESKSGKMALGKWGAEASQNHSRHETSGIEVAADVSFSGRETPREPNIVYFKNESDILSLIKMRMAPEEENRILSKKYSFKYGNSSGIRTSDAEKIDFSLAGFGMNLSRSFASEANMENNTLLEYIVEF